MFFRKRKYYLILFCSILCTSIFLSNIALSHEINDFSPSNMIDFEKKLNLDKVDSGMLSAKRNVIVAIVDTGVELAHPELIKHLIPGHNIIDPNQQPIDDNGHGTSLAGIVSKIAGKADNSSFQTKIMPIKSIKSNGLGSADKLSDGIIYAVDHRANIICLSLETHRDSTKLKNAIQYAEANNVLVIAASGNKGGDVAYPAAYPTVFAVGSIKDNNEIDSFSNFGPELDVVAPSNVYTTIRGGGFGFRQGTSMAAAEVTGVAALILAKYPFYKPYQIRNLIRQTTEHINEHEWDEITGYGVLRIDLALNQTYIEDMYEPNNSKLQAKPLPLGKMSSAQLATKGDTDWYYLDLPYDGNIDFHLVVENGLASDIQILLFNDKNEEVPLVNARFEKGRYFLKINSKDSLDSIKEYQITPLFHIYKDNYSNNKSKDSAYQLKPETQTLVGTFDSENDIDWFVLPIKAPTKIEINLTTDTLKIDPIIIYQLSTEDNPTEIDFNGAGEEESTSINVLQGDLYIAVSNNYKNEAIGEYQLKIQLDSSETQLTSDFSNKDSDKVNVIIDNEKMVYERSQVIVSDEYYVPLRSLFEEVGAEVIWDNDKHKATIIMDNIKLIFGENSPIVTENGDIFLSLDFSVKLINEKMMLPVKSLVQVFSEKKFDWGWNDNTNTLYISSLTKLSPSNPKRFLSQGHTHDLQLVTKFNYNSNPPTSGPHEEVFPSKLIMQSPMDIAVLVHMLEHGNIVIAYNQLPKNELDELVNWATEINKLGGTLEEGKKVLITPWPSLEPGTIDALAWTRTYTLSSFSIKDLTQFVDVWMANSSNIIQ
jgi:hypothetical protein